MTIKDLKEYFETTEKPKFFLASVFSWRGSYDEVAFEAVQEGNKAETLYLIHRALTESFFGWKGGSFSYDLDTEVHFESDRSACTAYTAEEYLK